MIGTLINAGGVVLGSLLGLLLKKGIPERINDAVTKAEGLAIMIIALNGIIAAMFSADRSTGKLSDSGGLLLLGCLVVGCIIGELIDIDRHLEKMGLWVEGRMNARGFAKGFITASLLFCVGAMSIIGPLNDGLRGDTSVLLVKSTLDFTTSIILASSLGVGVLFAAVPVLVLQGALAMLSRWIEPFISTELLNMVCMVGYTIVLAIGLNFVCKTAIKTANLLPALLLPIPDYFLVLPLLA